MWANHRANDVKRVIGIAHPVPDGFVGGVFQGLASACSRTHFRTQHFHPHYVQVLAFNVFRTHVHHALHPEFGAYGGRSYAVLSGAGFGNDACFAHPSCQ